MPSIRKNRTETYMIDHKNKQELIKYFSDIIVDLIKLHDAVSSFPEKRYIKEQITYFQRKLSIIIDYEYKT